MAFDLGGLFKGSASTHQSTSTVYADSIRQAATPAAAARELLHLVAGQTLQGEIIDLSGNEMQIQVGRDIVLLAKLESDVRPAIGQMMTFEVKNSTGNMLSLRPLQTNLTGDTTILKALAAAGLPVNENTAGMVSALMKEGMPIDRQTLLDTYKAVTLYPGTEPETLVQMKRMDLPITPETIGQFTQYKNYEHQITASVAVLAEEIPKEMLAALQNTDPAQSLEFVRNLLEGLEGAKEPELSLPAGEIPGEVPKEAAGEAQKEVFKEVPKEMAKEVLTDATGRLLDVLPDSAERERLAEGLLRAGANEKQMQDIREGSIPLRKVVAIVREFAAHAANTENAANTANEAKAPFEGQAGWEMQEAKEGVPAKTVYVQEGTPPRVQTAQAAQPSERETLHALLSSREFTKVLKAQIDEQFLLRPQDVAQKEKIEEFYEGLRKQAIRLTETLAKAAGADTALAKTAGNIRENIDFMHQLNQTFAYVQLPLKTMGKNAHGELYVYANKKNLIKKDGRVSALLHLDMENLGTVDVYVALEQEKLNTKFYLETEELLDFIESRLHLLTERLQKRGYHASTEAVVREGKPVRVMEEMIRQDKNISLLSTQAFDVRA